MANVTIWTFPSRGVILRFRLTTGLLAVAVEIDGEDFAVRRLLDG